MCPQALFPRKARAKRKSKEVLFRKGGVDKEKEKLIEARLLSQATPSPWA